MTVVKCKPTSAGRRHVVKVTTPDLYKGAPYKALLEAKRSRMIFLQKLNVSNTIQTVLQTLL